MCVCVCVCIDDVEYLLDDPNDFLVSNCFQLTFICLSLRNLANELFFWEVYVKPIRKREYL